MRFCRIYKCIQYRAFSGLPLVDLRLASAQRTKQLLADLRDRTTALMQESQTVLVPEPTTRPEKIGGFWYYQRWNADGGLMFCRVPHSAIGFPRKEEEEVLLNTGEFRTEGYYPQVVACKLSKDGCLIGVAVDKTGAENWELCIKKWNSSNDWLRVPGIRNFEFIDSFNMNGEMSAIIIETDQQTLRAIKASKICFTYSKVLTKETLIEAHNSAAYVDVVKSKNGEYIFISSSTKEEGIVWACNDHQTEPVIVAKGQPGEEVFCESWEDQIFVFSRSLSRGFRVLQGSWENIQKGEFYDSVKNKSFKEIFTPKDFSIKDVDMFQKGLVLYGHDHSGSLKIVSLSLQEQVPNSNPLVASLLSNNSVEPSFLATPPHPVLENASINLSVNGDYFARHAHLEICSPLQPGVALSFDMETGRIAAVGEKKFQKNNLSNFEGKKINVGDEKIPLTLFGPKDFFWKSQTPRPTLVHVYGAYGQCLEPQFSLASYFLLINGWRIAFAHVRGGGEKGPNWHARKSEKIHSLRDFKACCDFLVENGLTNRNILCASAVSAGGAVLGAALNEWGSDLVGGGVVMRMPFLDILSTLENPNLPLSLLERSEWGDPQVYEDRSFLESFSPAQNIKSSLKYPRTLITCASDDSRVPVEGTLKYAENMDKCGHGNLFLNVVQGGHFAEANDQSNLAMQEVAFLEQCVAGKLSI